MPKTSLAWVEPVVSTQSVEPITARVDTVTAMASGRTVRGGTESLVDARSRDPGAREISGEDDRDAILQALYRDRAELIDMEFLGTLTSEDKIRLRDIDREIGRWEAPGVVTADATVWDRLNKIAARAVDLDARIAGAISKG